MKAKVIKIGNSKGIRIPKPYIDQAGLKDEVKLEIIDNKIIIHPVSNIREGWESEFKKMAEMRDDKLIDEKYLKNQSNWDNEEWEW